MVFKHLLLYVTKFFILYALVLKENIEFQSMHQYFEWMSDLV